MANLLDDFAALNSLKQRNGLNPSNAQSIQPYLEECAFRQKLRDELSKTTIRNVSKDSGFSTFRIRELVESVVLDLGVHGLREANKILERKGLAKCLRYLSDY